MKLFVKNIRAMLLKEGEPVVETVSIVINNDIIEKIVEHSIENSVENAIEESTFDKIIDGTNKFIMPGLINAHTHSYMAFMRNCADDLEFLDWLFGKVDPMEQKMTDEDAYWGAKLAMLEMIKSGTTCFNDMQMNIHQTTNAAIESGMRAVIARGLVGSGEDEGGKMRLMQAMEEKEAAKEQERIAFFLGPHAPYTCDKDYLKIVANKAKQESMGIHIHLSESETEVKNCMETYQATPIEHANNCGLFEGRAIVAHAVYATTQDIRILKEKNVSVVTNPASNMKLGNGFAPIPEMLEEGVNVCLGTDGAASNNALNLFHEMNLLALIHKGNARKAKCVDATTCLLMATINGAKALGLDQQIGSIKEGKKADLIILDLKQPSMQPRNNILSSLVYSANGSEVETVIIDGQLIMENRKVLTLNEEEIYEKVNAIIKRMEKDA